MNLGWLHEVCPPGKSPPTTRVKRTWFPYKNSMSGVATYAKQFPPGLLNNPFFHGMIGETPVFHVHNFGVTQLEFQSRWTFWKKNLDLWSEATVWGLFLLGVEVKDEKNEIRNIYYYRDLEGAHTLRFWKVENCEGGTTSGLPPHEREIWKSIYFFTLIPCIHVMSFQNPTSFFFRWAKNFEQPEDPFRVKRGWRLPSRYTLPWN